MMLKCIQDRRLFPNCKRLLPARGWARRLGGNECPCGLLPEHHFWYLGGQNHHCVQRGWSQVVGPRLGLIRGSRRPRQWRGRAILRVERGSRRREVDSPLVVAKAPVPALVAGLAPACLAVSTHYGLDAMETAKTAVLTLGRRTVDSLRVDLRVDLPLRQVPLHRAYVVA